MRWQIIARCIAGIGLITSISTIGLLHPQKDITQQCLNLNSKKHSIDGIISYKSYVYENQYMDTKYLEWMRTYFLYFAKELWKDWAKRRKCEKVNVYYTFSLAPSYIIVEREIYFDVVENKILQSKYFRDIYLLGLRPGINGRSIAIRHAPDPVYVITTEEDEIEFNEELKLYIKEACCLSALYIAIPVVLFTVIWLLFRIK